MTDPIQVRLARRRCPFTAADVDELPGEARPVAQHGDVRRAARGREFRLRHTRRAPDEVDEGDIADAQPALVVQAHADVNNATLDVLEETGDAVAVAEEHGRSVLVSRKQEAGQRDGRHCERKDELSIHHAPDDCKVGANPAAFTAE